jgi:hypothetical protein
MADIFISYSKSDYAVALKLSAFLESEGWSVWWDKSLAVADHYRDEIMRQLVAARAVIAIWSPNSVQSDWVRAEAGRAKVEGKLIPVKTTELTYADIPLPFGEMHTENIASTDLIRAAIVAQLTKPLVSQSPFWQITALFWYQILIWSSIIGTAISLLTGFKDALDLAGLARKLVVHWQEWSEVFWGWVFSLFQLQIPREVVPIISFSVFTLVLVVGVNISSRIAGQSVRSNNAISVRGRLYIFGGGLLIYLGTMFIALTAILIAEIVMPEEWLGWPVMGITPLIALLLFSVYAIALAVPIGYLLYFLRERSWVLIASLLFLAMSGCLLFVPLLFGAKFSDDSMVGLAFGLSAFALLQVCWMAVIIFSPLQQLVRRLSFVVVGVLTLIGLSEISKLHEYLKLTRVSDNYLP